MSVFSLCSLASFLVKSLRIAEEKTEGDLAELVPTDTRTTIFLYCPSSFPIISSIILQAASASINLGIGQAHRVRRRFPASLDPRLSVTGSQIRKLEKDIHISRCARKVTHQGRSEFLCLVGLFLASAIHCSHMIYFPSSVVVDRHFFFLFVLEKMS